MNAKQAAVSCCLAQVDFGANNATVSVRLADVEDEAMDIVDLPYGAPLPSLQQNSNPMFAVQPAVRSAFFTWSMPVQLQRYRTDSAFDSAAALFAI